MVNRIFIILILSQFILVFLGFIGHWTKLMKTGYEAYSYQDYEAAIIAYQEAALNKPNNPFVHYNLGTAYYKHGKFKQAAYAFQTTLLKTNTHNKADIYYNLGNAQFQMHDLSAAVESYKSSLKLNPRDVDAKHNLNLALELLAEEEQNTTIHQDNNQSNQESPKHEPKEISKSETNRLLDLLSMNESRRRKKILKQQLDTGIWRDKDW